MIPTDADSSSKTAQHIEPWGNLARPRRSRRSVYIIVSTNHLDMTGWPSLRELPDPQSSSRVYTHFLSDIATQSLYITETLWEQNTTPVTPDRLVSDEDSEVRRSEVQTDLDHILVGASGKTLEHPDGESLLLHDLDHYLSRFGTEGLKELAVRLFTNELNPEVSTELLRWVGSIRSADTSNLQLWILRRALHHPLASVRYSALVGLTLLEDKRAIELLRTAAIDEPNEHVRTHMTTAASYLDRL